LATTYAAERITIDAAQLESWHGTASVTTLNLDGPCPRCQHPSPAEILRQVTALESGPGQSKTLTADLACTCRAPHAGRPDGASGCGRNWLVVTTVTSDGTVLLAPVTAAAPAASTGSAGPAGSAAPAGSAGPAASVAPAGPAPAPDPALVTAAQALRDTTGARQLADLRGAADKWTAGVVAIFSLFGLAGLTITRNALARLATGWQAGIAITAAASIALAGLSVYLIYRAAYGWPETYPVTDDAELLKWYQAQRAAPRVQATYLRNGVRTAGAALAILVATVGLLWFAPQEPATGPLVQATLTNGSQLCGTLLPARAPGTALIRRASDGTAVSVPLGSLAGLSTVTAC
jgi:hypothetical protein